ncbi:MAG: hypothetical protein AAFX76_07950, partial [Planctomycetota bacterium]
MLLTLVACCAACGTTRPSLVVNTEPPQAHVFVHNAEGDLVAEGLAPRSVRAHCPNRAMRSGAVDVRT